MSWPSTSTFPAVAFTIPQMMLMSVVLPAPFGPRSAKISPRRIARSTFVSARNPDAYSLLRFLTVRMGSRDACATGGYDASVLAGAAQYSLFIEASSFSHANLAASSIHRLPYRRQGVCGNGNETSLRRQRARTSGG